MADEKAAQSLVPSPERFAENTIKGLPTALGSVLLTIYAIFQWITVPASVLSAISDLRVATDFWRIIYEGAAALRPALDALETAVRPVLTAWRSLTAPLHRLILDWLPTLPLPQLLIDLALIALICVPSILRTVLLDRSIAASTRWFREFAERARSNARFLLQAINSDPRLQEEQKHRRKARVHSFTDRNWPILRGEVSDTMSEAHMALLMLDVYYDPADRRADRRLEDLFYDLKRTIAWGQLLIQRERAVAMTRAFLTFALILSAIGVVVTLCDVFIYGR